MNVVDLLALVVLVFGTVAGFRSGLLPQIGGVLGAVVAGVLAVAALPIVLDAIDDLDPSTRALAVLVGLLAIVGVGQGLGSGAGSRAGRSLGTGFLSAFDRITGGMAGAAQAVLVIWLAGGLLAAGPIPRLAEQASTSQAVRTLATILPPPTAFAGQLSAALDASGLPEVFVGLEPLPGPPVDRPTDPGAAALARDAAGSVARVTARACGQTLVGTSFAFADGYLVTNAHVVAGAEVVRVEAERVHDATVVLFDPALDIAVLHVPDLRLPNLILATEDPDRGTPGAVVGYPGGGDRTILPAAVSGAYRATGRDIYGRERVTRPLLEIQAAVERGDSGGPLVLGGRLVGGLVFAESRTSEDIGYALSPSTVAITIAPAVGRTGAVDPGACVR